MLLLQYLPVAYDKKIIIIKNLLIYRHTFYSFKKQTVRQHNIVIIEYIFIKKCHLTLFINDRFTSEVHVYKSRQLGTRDNWKFKTINLMFEHKLV